MKKWYLSLLFLFVFYGMKGQSYSGDVEFLSNIQGVVVVRTTGIHEKKKEASEMAIKSAFYAYFFSARAFIFSTASSLILYLRILPAAFIGNESTNSM